MKKKDRETGRQREKDTDYKKRDREILFKYTEDTDIEINSKSEWTRRKKIQERERKSDKKNLRIIRKRDRETGRQRERDADYKKRDIIYVHRRYRQSNI